MTEKTENRIYDEAIRLLIKDGTRFTVDDLSLNLHISKKTLYSFTSSKNVLAKWIYDMAFKNFELSFQSLSSDPDIKNPEFKTLLVDYAIILCISQDSIFNRYSLDMSIKEKTQKAMNNAKEKAKLLLSNTTLSIYLLNSSFWISFNSSLIALCKEADKKRISDYWEFLKAIVC